MFKKKHFVFILTFQDINLKVGKLHLSIPLGFKTVISSICVSKKIVTLVNILKQSLNQEDGSE